MLLVDVSNIIYSGSYSGKAVFCGTDNAKQLKGIPYLFSKIANYALKSDDVIFVFDPEITGEFATINPLKPNRVYNPQVLWELRVLRKLLKFIGTPIIESPGYSADDLIHTICELYVGNEVDIYILSADQDLSCNVREREGYYTRMLSYNVKSYNVDPSNFTDILRVPYNFISIHKLLLGCKSDNIAPYRCGKEIWLKFQEYLSSEVLVASKFESDAVKNFKKYLDPFDFNTQGAFFSWLSKETSFSDCISELKDRASIVFPKIKTGLSLEEPMSWERWNAVAVHLFYLRTYVYSGQVVGNLTDSEIFELNAILDNTPTVARSTFQPDTDIVISPVISGMEDLDVELGLGV